MNLSKLPPREIYKSLLGKQIGVQISSVKQVNINKLNFKYTSQQECFTVQSSELVRARIAKPRLSFS